MKLYSTTNNINGGARNDLHVLHVSCDAPPTKQQCSCGADLLTLSEYHINKHLTRVQAQVTGHRRCESTMCFTGNTLNSHTYCHFDSYKIVLTMLGVNPLLYQFALLRTFLPQETIDWQTLFSYIPQPVCCDLHTLRFPLTAVPSVCYTVICMFRVWLGLG